MSSLGHSEAKPKRLSLSKKKRKKDKASSDKIGITSSNSNVLLSPSSPSEFSASSLKKTNNPTRSKKRNKKPDSSYDNKMKTPKNISAPLSSLPPVGFISLTCKSMVYSLSRDAFARHAPELFSHYDSLPTEAASRMFEVCSPTSFRYVYQYLRDGKLSSTPSLLRCPDLAYSLVDDAEFLGLHALANEAKAYAMYDITVEVSVNGLKRNDPKLNGHYHQHHRVVPGMTVKMLKNNIEKRIQKTLGGKESKITFESFSAMRDDPSDKYSLDVKDEDRIEFSIRPVLDMDRFGGFEKGAVLFVEANITAEEHLSKAKATKNNTSSASTIPKLGSEAFSVGTITTPSTTPLSAPNPSHSFDYATTLRARCDELGMSKRISDVKKMEEFIQKFESNVQRGKYEDMDKSLLVYICEKSGLSVKTHWKKAELLSVMEKHQSKILEAGYPQGDTWEKEPFCSQKRKREVIPSSTEKKKKKSSSIPLQAPPSRISNKAKSKGKEKSEKKKSSPSLDPNANYSGPPPPKKNISAYLLFCNDHRPELAKTMPELKSTEQTKVLGKRWKDIDEVQKKAYEDKANEAKSKYILELEHFKQNYPDYVFPLKSKRRKNVKSDKRQSEESKKTQESSLSAMEREQGSPHPTVTQSKSNQISPSSSCYSSDSSDQEN